MPFGDHSGQSSQPVWRGVRGRGGQSHSGLIGVCRDLNTLPRPTLPLFLLLSFGVFLNVALRNTPLPGLSLDACS